MNRVLENLLSEDYAIRVGFILPPGAMRLVLQRHSEQTAVTAAIRRGELTEVELREFVARCLAQFKPGALLPGDLALATLAVSLERIQTKYAEEFLTTLGKLHLQEMPLSSRITREGNFTLPSNPEN